MAENNVVKSVKGTTNRFSAGRRVFFLLLFVFFFSVQLSFAQESPHGKIRFECSSCHTTDTWKMKKGGFNHEVTGFALTGQHKNVECASCHQGLKFAKTKAADCLSCHSDIHKSELGVNCLRCHTTQTWKISDMVQKHQASRFPLLGKHATLPCQSCHANAGQKQYAGTPTDCFSCHRNGFATTKNPNHTLARFSTNCVQCHQVTSFTWGTDFNHQATGFALTGAHVATACTDCHKNQIFKGTATQCVSCHQTQFNGTTNPNHLLENFSTQCQTCHTQMTWQPATFNHANTVFPLTGAHQATLCNQCHLNSQYQGLPTTCIGCHQTNFNTTTNPNHGTLQLSHNCTTCHTTTVWRPSTFNHDTQFFKIYSGRHSGKWNNNCASCHPTLGQYQLFTCTTSCHLQAQADTQHSNRPGYSYSSPACYNCHRNV